MGLVDMEKLVAKTASNFGAPFLQLIAFGGLLSFILRVDVTTGLISALRRQFGSDYQGTVQFLKDVELLPLVPVVTLFLFLLLLFITKHAVASVAQLLPPHVAFHSPVLVARLANPRHTLALWGHCPALGVEDVIATVDARLRELSADARADFQREVAYWRKRAAHFMRGFDSFKVLAYFAFVCGVVAAVREERPGPAVARAAAALVVAAVGATAALVQSLNSTYQETAIIAGLWARADDLWHPADEVTALEEQRTALIELAVGRWWSLRFFKAGSLLHYLDILRGDAISPPEEVDTPPAELSSTQTGGEG